MSVVVFCGPTIDAASVEAILAGADCRPPAAQGDLFAAARDGPRAIALIDGVFCERPAVWHREILAALEAGIAVWGAASMGALRAVECAPFGMVGHGRIVEAYRRGRYPPYREPFEDDDEVAVVHGPAELGAPSLSDALVDLREALARATAAGAIDDATRDELAATMKRTFFAERTFDALLAAARERTGEAASALTAHRCSQKREDAVAMLTALADRPPAATAARWRRERTVDWERFAASLEDGDVGAADRAVLAGLEREPSRWRRWARRAAMRLAARDLASAAADEREVLAAFRHERELMSRASLDAWLDANGLSPAGFARLLRDEAALDDLAARLPRARLERAILDELRLAGEYGPGAATGSGGRRPWEDGR